MLRMQYLLHSGTMDEFLWIIYWSANQKCIEEKILSFQFIVLWSFRAPIFVFCSNLFSNQTVSKVYSCQWTSPKRSTETVILSYSSLLRRKCVGVAVFPIKLIINEVCCSLRNCIFPPVLLICLNSVPTINIQYACLADSLEQNLFTTKFQYKCVNQVHVLSKAIGEWSIRIFKKFLDVLIITRH